MISRLCNVMCSVQFTIIQLYKCTQRTVCKVHGAVKDADVSSAPVRSFLDAELITSLLLGGNGQS